MAVVAEHPSSSGQLDLLLESKLPREPARVRYAAAGSVLIHLLGILIVMNAPPMQVHRRTAPEITADLRRATPLVLPQDLTQRDPNRGEIAQEFDLEDLLPKPQVRPPQPQPGSTRPAARIPLPKPQAAPPTPSALNMPDPPKVDARTAAPEAPVLAQQLPPAPGIGEIPGPVGAPPPRIQETEPKIAFENPRSAAAQRDMGASGGGRLPLPKTSVSETLQDMARAPQAGGVIVGDLGEGIGGLGGGLNAPPGQGRNASALELLSDPQGVDFRPYLVQILSSVRRNWFAVIPESAKLGRRGKVLIQFAIDKDGRVPKLVIASSSGSDPLDRAAVAGISASNPFPPLPSEFRGNQIRLQFTFSYNTPRR
jgi:TonB family protein